MTLKPRGQRTASADEIIARLRPQLAKVKGIALFMQASQDLNVRRLTRTQYQYTLQDADLDELKTWAPRIADKLKTLPQLRDVATDQQANGDTSPWSSTATRLHASGSSHRISIRRSTMPSDSAR